MNFINSKIFELIFSSATKIYRLNSTKFQQFRLFEKKNENKDKYNYSSFNSHSLKKKTDFHCLLSHIFY